MRTPTLRRRLAGALASCGLLVTSPALAADVAAGTTSAPADAVESHPAGVPGSASCKGLHATFAFLSADPHAVHTTGCLTAEDGGVVWRVQTFPRTTPPRRADDPWARQCARYAPQGINVTQCEADLTTAKAATTRYADVANAVADGYAPISQCESDATGAAMGEHWARPDRMVNPSLSPAAPAILLYLPTTNGFRLLGAEYEENASVGGLPYYGLTPPPSGQVSPAPAMFGGKVFDGPMQGHSPVQPWHYDLHVWLWAQNPAGVFAQYNPTIHC